MALDTRNRIYLDWAATAGDCGGDEPDGAFANPSSVHAEGRRAREALEEARRRCAAVLGVPPETLYWTSGGSEANAVPLYARLLAAGGAARTGRIAASAAEHPSVSRPLETLARLGVPLSALPLNPDGCIEEESLGRLCAAAPAPALVSIPLVNGETGCVQPLARLVARVRAESARRVHVHSDCVQALGKLPFNPGACDIDSAAFSAHKIGGPRGMGLLYLRKPLDALVKGGGQERGIRPGTENVAGALAFARRVERFARADAVPVFYAQAARRANRLLDGLGTIERCAVLPRARRPHDTSGVEAAALLSRGGYSPYIVAAAFDGIPGELMTRALDEAGFAVSAGAACSSGAKKKPALEALGIDAKTARETIRISQGYATGDADIDALLEALRRVVKTF